MKFLAAVCSAKGIRDINEDSFIMGEKINQFAKSYSEEQYEGNDSCINFLAIADGMGGQGSGEKASYLVVHKLKDISSKFTELNEEILNKEITEIHNEIILENSKMGSTLTGIIFQKGNKCIINLGDSRTYRLRHDMFLKMTNDDSLQRYDSTAASNVITNGIGGGLKNISVNCRFSDKLIIPGDKFLMCSDGIHNFVSDTKIEELLSQNLSVSEISTKILQTAITNGSDDNCTALVVKFEE